MTEWRRRPVPREWREQNHYLSAHAHRGYHVRGGGYTSKAGGVCSCGETFGTRAGKHNRNAADVRDDWMDHVEEAYYGPLDAGPDAVGASVERVTERASTASGGQTRPVGTRSGAGAPEAASVSPLPPFQADDKGGET
jgi:hypothetical protein